MGVHRSPSVCVGSGILNMKLKGFSSPFRKEICELDPYGTKTQNADYKDGLKAWFPPLPPPAPPVA